MKKIIIILWLISIHNPVSSQDSAVQNTLFNDAAFIEFYKDLRFFLRTDSTEDKEKALQSAAELFAYFKEIQALKNENDRKFIRQVFIKTHKKYLKKYKAYSCFNELFDKGYFDCVTGTTLFALIFKQLNYNYEIKETPFHAYLLVYLPTGEKFLLESTSFLYGLVEEEKEIKDREAEYTRLHCREGDITFNRSINLKQLAGLHYYNRAVTHFNQKSFDKANFYLSKAVRFYKEDRIEALLELSQTLAKK